MLQMMNLTRKEKLGNIKLVVNCRDSILRVKSKLESVVGVTAHEMIISNASDEDMSDEKSLAMCKVAMGSFIIIKRRSGGWGGEGEGGQAR